MAESADPDESGATVSRSEPVNPMGTVNKMGAVFGNAVQAGRIDHMSVTVVIPQPRVPLLLLRQPRGFLNRHDELQTIDGWIAVDRAAGEPTLIEIVGPGGVGKTALLSRYTRANRDRFRGGVVTAELGGSAANGPTSPAAVLEIFLEQMGIPTAVIPTSEAGRLGMFRSYTEGQEILVGLDDVATAAQVLTLLPTSSRAVVLVTSRRPLPGLAAQDFRRLRVKPLVRETAIDLVCARLTLDGMHDDTHDDLAVDRVAAGALVDACGGRPYVLKLAAAQVAGHHQGRVDSYLRELLVADPRAAGPAGDLEQDEPTVEAVIDAAYRELDEAEARAYRLLALMPGREFGLPAAAVLLSTSEPATRALLDALVGAGVLEHDVDRYWFLDLQRDHAGRQSTAQDGADEAVRCLLDWYLRWVIARDLLLSDRVRDWDWAEDIAPAYLGPDARARAVQDLAAERPTLLAAVRLADDRGLDEACWRLCDALWSFYFQRDHYEDAIVAFQVGVRAAERTGHPLAALRMHTQLGVAHYSIGENDLALLHLRRSLELATAQRLPAEVQNAVVWTGLVHEQMGQLDEALADFERARRLTLAVPDESKRPRMMAMLDMHIGRVQVTQERFTPAVDLLESAARFFADVPAEQTNLARVLLVLGRAGLRAGRPAEAIPRLLAARETFQDREMLSQLTQIFDLLAEAYQRVGQPEPAAEARASAAKLFAALGDRQAAAARRRHQE
jgi:tetratricopeptide (TPR) repeat protein